MAKFKKGQSGNPVGRPKGKSTLQELRELLKPHAEELVTKVVEMAKAGDSAALRLCLERLIPPIKARDTPITLDKFTGTLTEQGAPQHPGRGEAPGRPAFILDRVR